MDALLAARSRSIDPKELGNRIKASRVAAGLTQTELAGDAISAAYVSRIEDGQRRPGAALLEQLAGRLGVSVDELVMGVSRDQRMEIRVQLDYAELAMATGDADSALLGADEVLQRTRDLEDPDLRRSAHILRATALEAVGQVQEAIALLEELVAEPAADTGWLKSLIALSRCYRESGDLVRAIEVGEKAAGTIAELGLEGLTEAIQLTITVAAAHMYRGDVDHALRMCHQAIEAAAAHGSPMARASAYWNASLIQSRKGEHKPAHELAVKALALFEVGEDARNLARIQSFVAELKLKLDPPDAVGALRTLDAADRDMATASASVHDVADARMTRGRALFLLGKNAEALAEVQAAEQLAPDAAPLLRASISVLEGEIALAEHRVDDGRVAFLSAIRSLSGIGADREAAQLWFELGDLLQEVGETDAALDAFRRAATSTGLAGSIRRRQGALV